MNKNCTNSLQQYKTLCLSHVLYQILILMLLCCAYLASNDHLTNPSMNFIINFPIFLSHPLYHFRLIVSHIFVSSS